jgi:hypothetical protein
MTDMFNDFRNEMLRPVPLEGFLEMVFANVAYCDPAYFLFNYLPRHITRFNVTITERPVWLRQWTQPPAYDVCFCVHPNDARACMSHGAQLKC